MQFQNILDLVKISIYKFILVTFLLKPIWLSFSEGIEPFRSTRGQTNLPLTPWHPRVTSLANVIPFLLAARAIIQPPVLSTVTLMTAELASMTAATTPMALHITTEFQTAVH
jgi:hypothetical protein